MTASVTAESIGGDGCDGCDALIELNKEKIEKKVVEEKNKEKILLTAEEELPVLASHPSQEQPQTNMNQEVQGIINPSQLPSQSVKSITEAERSVLTPSNNESSASELRWLLQFLADLESETKPHPRFKSVQHLFELFKEAEQRAVRVEEELERSCPDYFERVSNKVGELSILLSLSDEMEAPSIPMLQSELLACSTLPELKAVAKKYSSYRSDLRRAYRTLSTQEQLKIDAIKASALNQEVYKYTGVTLSEDGQTLDDGALVYIDLDAPRSTSSYVKVWLLNGLNKGWQKAVCVSRDFLTLVDKAVDGAAALVEGDQGELFASI